jgi:hypothetical protein
LAVWWCLASCGSGSPIAVTLRSIPQVGPRPSEPPASGPSPSGTLGATWYLSALDHRRGRVCLAYPAPSLAVRCARDPAVKHETRGPGSVTGRRMTCPGKRTSRTSVIGCGSPDRSRRAMSAAIWPWLARKELASAAVTLTTTVIGRCSRAVFSSRTTRSGGRPRLRSGIGPGPAPCRCGRSRAVRTGAATPAPRPQRQAASPSFLSSGSRSTSCSAACPRAAPPGSSRTARCPAMSGRVLRPPGSRADRRGYRTTIDPTPPRPRARRRSPFTGEVTAAERSFTLSAGPHAPGRGNPDA